MAPPDPAHPPLLERSLASGRLHSAYLLAGPGPAPREAALAFARALVCSGAGTGPCEACRECARSSERDEISLDGSGKAGPLLRHIGDHPDLLWIERGSSDTRVRIAQIRKLQLSLRLRGEGEGRRAGVVADAEWLNPEAQNALLHVLEEPPPRTTLILVAASSASLLATVRNQARRCLSLCGGCSRAATQTSWHASSAAWGSFKSRRARARTKAPCSARLSDV